MMHLNKKCRKVSLIRTVEILEQRKKSAHMKNTRYGRIGDLSFFDYRRIDKRVAIFFNFSEIIHLMIFISWAPER